MQPCWNHFELEINPKSLILKPEELLYWEIESPVNESIEEKDINTKGSRRKYGIW